LGSGLESVGYDRLGRITDQRWEVSNDITPGNDPIILRFEHQTGDTVDGRIPRYDGANNPLIEFKEHNQGASEQYKYDSANRLAAPSPYGSILNYRAFERGTFNSDSRAILTTAAYYQDWNLDGVGNKTWFDDNGREEDRKHTEFNEISERTVNASDQNLDYDKNGNLTNTDAGSTDFPGSGLELQWDALNRLRVAKNPQVYTVSPIYIYDADNRRVRKYWSDGVDQTWTDYFYDGVSVIEERNEQNKVVKQYVYGGYEDERWCIDSRLRSDGTVIPVADLHDDSGNERHFYHWNTRYSVCGLTNEEAELVEAYEYDAYGCQTVISDGDADGIVNFDSSDVVSVGGISLVGNVYLFTGRRLDEETVSPTCSGLLHYRARYFSPDIGTFISRDPAKDGSNWYQYAGSNTLVYIDPSGETKEVVAFGKGVFDSIWIPGEQFGMVIGEHGWGTVPLMARGISATANQGPVGVPVIGWVPNLVAGVYKGIETSVVEYGDDHNMAGVYGYSAGTFGSAVLMCVAPEYMAARLPQMIPVAYAGTNVVRAAATVMRGSSISIKMPKTLAAFKSFYLFKKAFGPAGKGRAWHHIVQQHKHNIKKFGAERIHNTQNLVNLPHGRGTVHNALSDLYNSKTAYSVVNGKKVRVREWLRTQSFAEQYQFGIDQLKRLGVKIDF